MRLQTLFTSTSSSSSLTSAPTASRQSACSWLTTPKAARSVRPQHARRVTSMAGHGKFFVGGNWKCNGSLSMVKQLVQELNEADVPKSDSVEIVVAPTFVHLDPVRLSIQAPYQVAAQNCWQEPCGAYTGEVSAEMLKDMEVHWVILGHSERRHIVGESDAHIGEKIQQALTSGLKVIACIGETEAERDAGQAFSVVDRQMAAISKVVDASQWDQIVIAYEPVWAIGTGKVATPDIAQEIHHHVREWVENEVSKDVATGLRLVYGGSVSDKNAGELAQQTDIDGFLVGGASLKAGPFAAICNAQKATVAA